MSRCIYLDGVFRSLISIGESRVTLRWDSADVQQLTYELVQKDSRNPIFFLFFPAARTIVPSAPHYPPLVLRSVPLFVFIFDAHGTNWHFLESTVREQSSEFKEFRLARAICGKTVWMRAIETAFGRD